MNLRICGLLGIAAFAVSCLLGSSQTVAQNAYVTNTRGWVSVIDTVTNSQITTIPVATLGVTIPQGVAVSPVGSTIYITNSGANGGASTVSVIAVAANTVTATIPIPAGNYSYGVAVTPDGSTVYVTNSGANTVSVIATATNTVTASIPVGINPFGVAVTPDGSKVYVTNSWLVQYPGSVSVIDTATDTATATIPLPVGAFPFGVAVSPDGSKVYVANGAPEGVAVIDTATNMVTAAVLGSFDGPEAFGVFIQPPKPAPKFAGTPGKTNCYGKSVSALVAQFGGLNGAAAGLGFSGVEALQNAILAFCKV
jgi:YVTN family beta-propeller protein